MEPGSGEPFSPCSPSRAPHRAICSFPTVLLKVLNSLVEKGQVTSLESTRDGRPPYFNGKLICASRHAGEVGNLLVRGVRNSADEYITDFPARGKTPSQLCLSTLFLHTCISTHSSKCFPTKALILSALLRPALVPQQGRSATTILRDSGSMGLVSRRRFASIMLVGRSRGDLRVRLLRFLRR